MDKDRKSLGIYSLGEFCATAYQIRRYTGNQNAFFFDWLITHSDYFRSISLEIDTFFKSENWDIVDGGIRLRDLATGLLYQHEFPAKDGQIEATLAEGHMDSARSKFEHLKEKTLSSMRNDDECLLIRAENDIISVDQARERMMQIRGAFLPYNSNIKIVLASTGCIDEIEEEDRLFIGLKPGADWTGNDSSWDRLFQITASVFKLDIPIASDMI